MRFFFFPLLLSVAAATFDESHNFAKEAFELAQSSRFPEALVLFQRALDVLPISDETKDFRGTLHSNIGTAQAILGDEKSGLQSWLQTLKFQETNADIRSNVVKALLVNGRNREALSIARKGIELHPDRAEAFRDFGRAAHDLHLMGEAREALTKAVALDPKNFDAYFSLGSVLRDLNELEEALAMWRLADELKPGDKYLINAIAVVTGDICAWIPQTFSPNLSTRKKIKKIMAAFDASVATLRKIAEDTCEDRDGSAGHPLLLTYYLDDPDLILRVARSRISATARRLGIAAPLPQEISLPDLPLTPNIKIAFLSSDFRDHPTAHLLQGFFKILKIFQAVEIFVYSNTVDDGSMWYKEMPNEVGPTHWIKCLEMSQPEIAAHMNRNEIQILIDLKQHTQENFINVLIARPAPITNIYLGFPGTLGARVAHYVISDRVVTPPEHTKYFDEKLSLLPHSYQINTFLPRPYKPAPRPFKFICLNHPRKIKPETFFSWMEIIDKTPQSELHLLIRHDSARKNILSYATVSPLRINLESVLGREEHLERLSNGGLFLDTFPYTAHTTATEALSVNLLILTLPGASFHSRVTASLLTAVNMTELISRTRSDYKNIAIRSPQIINKLKQKLAAVSTKSPLFDTEMSAEYFSRMMKMQWETALHRARPYHIILTQKIS